MSDNLLAAHTVQINDQDIALLESCAVAIAHCPRSNIKLKCGKAPLNKILRSKLRIGLGTDSSASNDDLDLLAESRFAIELHQTDDFKLSAKQMIEYLTIKAAQCLNMEEKLGSLEEGKFADLAVFSVLEKRINEDDPYELLLFAGAKVQALFIDGREVIVR